MLGKLSKDELRQRLIEAVGNHLYPLGFMWDDEGDYFFRDNGSLEWHYYTTFLDYYGDWKISPSIGVRVKKVEEIFHKTSGFEKADQRFGCTVGCSVRDYVEKFLPDCAIERTFDCEIQKRGDIAKSAEFLCELFDTFAMPFFEKYLDLHEIDHALNDYPDNLRILGAAMYSERMGMIVAKILNRKDYDELVQKYSKELKARANGFYLPGFEALVLYLKENPPNAGSELLPDSGGNDVRCGGK